MSEQAKGVPLTIACRRCGRQMVPRSGADNPDLHVNCGIANAVAAAAQMHARSGPAWDRWLASNGPRGRPRRTVA